MEMKKKKEMKETRKTRNMGEKPDKKRNELEEEGRGE